MTTVLVLVILALAFPLIALKYIWTTQRVLELVREGFLACFFAFSVVAFAFLMMAFVVAVIEAL